jgi:hypothetical protein
VDAISILNRPQGRLQHPMLLDLIEQEVKFQSSTARKGGCNGDVLKSTGGGLAFQSSTARKGGCNPLPICQQKHRLAELKCANLASLIH